MWKYCQRRKEEAHGWQSPALREQGHLHPDAIVEEEEILFFFQLRVTFIGMAWGKEGLQVNSVTLPVAVGCFVPSFTSLTHTSVGHPSSIQESFCPLPPRGDGGSPALKLLPFRWWGLADFLRQAARGGGSCLLWNRAGQARVSRPLLLTSQLGSSLRIGLLASLELPCKEEEK